MCDEHFCVETFWKFSRTLLKFSLFGFFTFADRQEEIWIPRVKLELVDGISMTYIMLDLTKKGVIVLIYSFSARIISHCRANRESMVDRLSSQLKRISREDKLR